MNDSPIHELETVFLLLLSCVVVFAFIARKLKTPYPIVLVLAGLIIGFIPGIPPIKLNPDVIFLLVLPPLLYHASWIMSWREFRFNIVSISMLAFGLVGFTVLAVAFLAPQVLHGFDWRLGFVLGAVVAPTDAIAATSIAKRIGLPGRIVDLLEGESLLNDASGLLALEFGTAMLFYGQTPTLASGIGRLVWLVVGGVASGLIVGYVVDRFERKVDYGGIEITLSILVPYVTYLLAEGIHASGVLAVVACGLFVSWRSAEFYAPDVRLQSAAVWETISFILNGLTFVLIGLQLPAIRASIGDHQLPTLLLDGITFTALLILLRLVWVFCGGYLGNFVRRRVFKEKLDRLPPRPVFILGWTGMRGVIALAAAISLPTVLENGMPFPQRNVIVFLTFCVILATLVIQGLTLPAVIRALGVSKPLDGDEEERQARIVLLKAALAYLREQRAEQDGRFSGVYDHVFEHYERRLEEIEGVNREGSNNASVPGVYRDLQMKILQMERDLAVRLRNEGRINDEVLRRLQHELDLGETRLGLASS